MRETLRNIFYIARRFKLATTFNMLGLVLAFVTFYIAMTQVHYQKTYNHDIEDYERLFRLESNYCNKEWRYSVDVVPAFGLALDARPEVESYSMISSTAPFTFIINKDTCELKLSVCNSKAVSALTSKNIDGCLDFDCKEKRRLIIPKSTAIKFFGKESVAGDSLYYIDPDSHQKSGYYTVRGVFEDFPINSELSPPIDELSDSNLIYNLMDSSYHYEMNAQYHCYIKFKEVPEDLEAESDSIKQTIYTYMKKIGWKKYGSNNEEVHIKNLGINLTPLRKSYFEHSTFSPDEEKGYMGMLIISVLTCFFVIIMAMINFLNFTLAESPMRVRGLNTRRVLGASLHSLRLGMISECVVTSLLACIVAMLLCNLLPITSRLTDGNLSLSGHWILVLQMVFIAIVMGIIAGIYPALHATSFSPAIALKGNFGLTPQGEKLRSILVCIQLLVSLVVVIYIGFLLLQNYYIYKSPYGYDKDHILVTSAGLGSKDRQSLRHELMRIPGVDSVSFSYDMIGTIDGHYFQKTSFHEQPITFSYMTVDTSYLRTMGIQMIEGRNFLQIDTASAAIVINESAHKEWGWIKLGMRISTGVTGESTDSATVIGVCEDVRFGSIRINHHNPFAFILDQSYDRKIGEQYFQKILNIRVSDSADHENVRLQVDSMMNKATNGHFEKVEFYNDKLKNVYQSEFRYFQQVGIVSIVCIIITLIGTLCLTIFETEYRRKEIGLRKVAGATTREIVTMLCRRYAWLVLISFVVAIPIAYFCSNLTLSYFAEHTDIVNGWWIFPLGLLFVGGITLGTVALQSWRAARENPVNSIRTE